MKRSPFRLASILLPAAFFIAACVKQDRNIFDLFCVYLIQLVLSCNAPGSFRDGAATEPGVRKVESRFIGAVCQSVIGIVILFALHAFISLPIAISVTLIAVSSLILIVQLLEERLFAIGRETDGTLLSLISSVLLSAGLITDHILVPALISLAIAATVTLFNRPITFRKPIFNFPFTMRSLLRDWMCPALMTLPVIFLSQPMAYAFAAWMITRACRTFARCSADESRRPLFALSFVLMLSAAVPLILPAAAPIYTIAAACLITQLVSLSFYDRSIITMTATFAVTALSFFAVPLIAFIVSIIAFVASFDKRIFLRKVG